MSGSSPLLPPHPPPSPPNCSRFYQEKWIVFRAVRWERGPELRLANMPSQFCRFLSLDWQARMGVSL